MKHVDFYCKAGFVTDTYISIIFNASIPLPSLGFSCLGLNENDSFVSLTCIFDEGCRIHAITSMKNTINGQAALSAGASVSKADERLRMFIAASSNILYRMNADWTCMEHLIGRGMLADTPEPITGWMEKYILPEDQPEVQSSIQNAISTKSIFEMEHRVRQADDSVGWVHSKAIPLLNVNGNITEWFGAGTDITERKRTEVSLRNSKGLLRAIIENLPGGAVFILDLSMRYTLAGGDALASTGFTEADFIGKTLTEAIPTQADEQMPNYRRVLAGEPFTHEHEVNGRTFVSRGIPLRNASGEVYAALVVSYDITERKRVENDLELSRERLRVTMESAMDYAIITTDVKGLIEGWSKGAEKMFGYTEEEMLCRNTSLIFTLEDVYEGIPMRQMQVASSEGRSIDERWHMRRDGSRFWMSGVTTPIYDGKLSGYVKIARDLTRRQQIEEALQVSEERYRTALQSADMAAWDWDAVADEAVWNDQHYFIFGLKPDGKKMNAASFIRFVHPYDSQRVSEELQDAAERTGIYKSEFRIIRADGQVRWMNGYGRAVGKDEHGRAKRMVGVMYDITERKRLEQQKEEFLGIASHELKTPITSLSAYAELLQVMLEEDGDMAKAGLMAKLNNQVDRLTDLITALLDTTKISEGQMPLYLEDFDLGELIQVRVEELQHLSTHHILIVDECATIAVQADHDRISQVLTNLVSNAIKYSPEGGEVHINCRMQGNLVQVSIEDQGIGISQDMQARVFDRFFRANEVKQQNLPGLGLGLYITAGIVRRHGGNIWVESAPGKGSVFSFTLPIKAYMEDTNPVDE